MDEKARQFCKSERYVQKNCGCVYQLPVVVECVTTKLSGSLLFHRIWPLLSWVFLLRVSIKAAINVSAGWLTGEDSTPRLTQCLLIGLTSLRVVGLRTSVTHWQLA